MITGNRQFSVLKSLLRKSLPCNLLKRFFYARGLTRCGFAATTLQKTAWRQTPVRLYRNCNPAPAPLFSFPNYNASQKRVVGLSKHSHKETHCRMGVRQRLRKGFRESGIFNADKTGQSKGSHLSSDIPTGNIILSESLFSVVV